MVVFMVYELYFSKADIKEKKDSKKLQPRPKA